MAQLTPPFLIIYNQKYPKLNKTTPARTTSIKGSWELSFNPFYSIQTLVSSSTQLANSIKSALRMRIHPRDPGLPNSVESGVP